ncbi:MAG TPA: SAM-dependent methyltransferase, partial [Vicinamibacteria bacterium]
EQTNARRLSPAEVPETCGLAVMDVSFISASKILPALLSVLAAGADVVVLVKPQFEVGRADVGRGGIVKDRRLHRQALQDVARAAQAHGYGVAGAAASPIDGAEGNREFLLHLRVDGPVMAEPQLAALVEKTTGARDAADAEPAC